MLTFNQLLRTVGLDPKTVRLVRHRDQHYQRAVFDAALRGDVSFDEYQANQGTEQVIAQFRDATYLAAFVAEPLTNDTIFVGMWKQLGDSPGPSPRVPLGIAGTQSAAFAFNTQRVDELASYRGRLVIDWGDGARAWVQRADKQDKPIVEVRRRIHEPPFPGFLRLRLPLDQVGDVPPAWANALRSVRGIYLWLTSITCTHQRQLHRPIGLVV